MLNLSKMAVSIALVILELFLLKTLTISFCDGEFVVTTDDHDAIMEMCQAQSEAWCNDDGQSCQNRSATLGTSLLDKAEWLMNCSDPTNNQTDAECQGTCSLLPKQAGYVPPRPDVRIRRDPVTSLIQLSWNLEPLSSSIIYVIAQGQSNVTGVEGKLQFTRVHGDMHQIGQSSNVCYAPEFRVAAVSRYGSRWFSDSVITPALIPGPPTDINLANLIYSPSSDNKFINVTLEWKSPVGWNWSDINTEHPYEYLTDCNQHGIINLVNVVSESFKVLMHKVVLSVHTTSFQDQHIFSMTGLIPTYSIGCRITFYIHAVSRCSENLMGPPGNYTLDLIVYPGKVKKVNFSIVPDIDGFIGLLSWKPPDDLGSFELVDFYHVFWGSVDLATTDSLTDFKRLLGHATVLGTEQGTDLYLNITCLDANETIGVVVTAAAHGQVVDIPSSDIYLPVNFVTHETRTGHVLADDGLVLVLQSVEDVANDSSVEVDIYWRRFQLETDQTWAVGYDVLLGKVNYKTKGSLGNTLEADGDPQFLPTNVTRARQVCVTLQDLLPNRTYGVKLIPVYNMTSDILDEHSEAWNQVDLHTFITLPVQGNDTTSGTRHTLEARKSDLLGLDIVKYVAIAMAGVVILLLAALMACKVKRSKRRKRHQTMAVVDTSALEYGDYSMFETGLSNDSSRPAHCSVVVDEWELPLSCVKFGPILGSGAFGNVVKGRVTRAMLTQRGVAPLLADDRVHYDDVTKLHVTVAIKMLQEDCDRRYKQDFLKEIQLMKKIGHHQYIVSMLGCCTLREPICLVVEHADFGDLLNYLKDFRQTMMPSRGNHYVNRDVDTLSPKDLLSFAWHVTQGMNFLASKGFVHRDLAARNVLVCADRTCKIGDFGLARYTYDNAVYVNRRGGRLPVKWMSVEAIFDMSFSTASDVWSFGIFLYELVTLGGTPYPTISTRDLLVELQRGYRMEKPNNCSIEIYEMMRQCWESSPKDRPTFCCLSQRLEAMISDTSATDCISLPYNFDRDLYNVEDDKNVLDNHVIPETCSQRSSTGSRTSQYSGVVIHDDETAPSEARKALSEDSGYSSPQKESVSSGDSTMALPADTARENRYWTEGLVEVTNPDSSIQFIGTFSEVALDDVFHEDEGIDIGEGMGPAVSTCQIKGKTTLSTRRDRTVKLSQICRDNPGSSRSKTDSIHVYQRRHSLPMFVIPLYTKANVRRRSDSGILAYPKKTDVMSQPIVQDVLNKTVYGTLEVPRQVKKCPGQKQRRKAVVIPPTLALDNDMYLASGNLPRQDPPPVRIWRKKRRNKGFETISPHTWTDDGQINFKRWSADKIATEYKPSSLSPETRKTQISSDSVSNENIRRNSYTIEVDVHREFPLSDDDFKKSSFTEHAVTQTLSCENTPESLLSQTKLETDNSLREMSRSPRTFVRSRSRALTTDSLVTRCKNGSKKMAALQHQPVPDHQYADFQKIVHQSRASAAARSTNADVTCQILNKHWSFISEEFFHTGGNGVSNSTDAPGHSQSQNSSFHNKCQIDVSQSWKNASILTDILRPLTQVLRRTYSSPKEHTLADRSMCDHTDGLAQKDEHCILLRRLSDPFTMSVNRMHHLSSSRQHSKICSSQSMSTLPYTTGNHRCHQDTKLPGQSAACFLWPNTRRRKKAVTERPKLDMDIISKRPFQNKKHPAALHHVTNLNVNWN